MENSLRCFKGLKDWTEETIPEISIRGKKKGDFQCPPGKCELHTATRQHFPPVWGPFAYVCSGGSQETTE